MFLLLPPTTPNSCNHRLHAIQYVVSVTVVVLVLVVVVLVHRQTTRVIEFLRCWVVCVWVCVADGVCGVWVCVREALFFFVAAVGASICLFFLFVSVCACMLGVGSFAPFVRSFLLVGEKEKHDHDGGNFTFFPTADDDDGMCKFLQTSRQIVAAVETQYTSYVILYLYVGCVYGIIYLIC